MWTALAASLSEARGRPFAVAERSSLGGGCINRAYRVVGTDGSRYFVKANEAAALAMFEAEAAALGEIAATETIRVPTPVACGAAGREAYLVLEYIDLGGRGDPTAMGRQLAALHRHTAGRFGWHRDNTIGSTAQENAWAEDWTEFYRERRLRPQLALAARRGHPLARAEPLLEQLPRFFETYRPTPSLLHGDLWGGNAAYDAAGQPVVFDPASYYGDRETDLAMTELFGGFGSAFHGAYDEAWERDPGYVRRRPLYHLYHILNHANLFGGGYIAQAQAMVDALVA